MKLSEHPAVQGLHIPAAEVSRSLIRLAQVDNTVRQALERGDAAAAVSKAFRSRWTTLGKAVQGGLNFVIAADSGANYAELWSRGKGDEANWYAVTGAGVHEVSDIKKGMPYNQAFDRFLAATVQKADCKPCQQSRG